MPGKRIAAIALTMLASCTSGSNGADQEGGGANIVAIPLVEQADWRRLDPFYVFNCSVIVDTADGHFQFNRTYMPDGRLGDVHATWQMPITAMPPRMMGVFNSENGRDFALENGVASVDWEFIPALRPSTIRSRLSIGGLPFAPEPIRGTVPGMISTLEGSNSIAMASLGWRDFIGAMRDGAVNVRVDVTGAPAGWKNRLYPGYLTGMTVVGNDALERPISGAMLQQVERQLQLMAAQTNVPRREDVPRRCEKTDQVSVED